MSFRTYTLHRKVMLAMNVFPLKDIIAVKQSTVFTDMFQTPLRKNSASTSNKHLALLKSKWRRPNVTVRVWSMLSK